MEIINLTTIKGNDQTYNLTFSDQAGVIDITGWTIYFVVKDQRTNHIILSKEITTHSDPLNGISEIVLTHSETNVSSDVYKYTLSVMTDLSEIYSIAMGFFIVNQSEL